MFPHLSKEGPVEGDGVETVHCAHVDIQVHEQALLLLRVHGGPDALRGEGLRSEPGRLNKNAAAAAAAAKSLQSCPTLCDPIDGSLFNASRGPSPLP